MKKIIAFCIVLGALVAVVVTFFLVKKEHSTTRVSESSLEIIPANPLYFVIADNITASPQSGDTEGLTSKKLEYGTEIRLDTHLQIMSDNNEGTGLFIKSKNYVLPKFIEGPYKQLVPIDVDTYRKIPSEIKQALFRKELQASCGYLSLYDSVMENYNAENWHKLFTPAPGTGMNATQAYARVPELFQCRSAISLDRTKTGVKNSVAYADLDGTSSLKPDTLLLFQNNNEGIQQDCDTSMYLFTLDANSNYFAQKLLTEYPACAVATIKSGTQITAEKEGVLVPLVLEHDSFVLTHENGKKTYIINSNDTLHEFKIIHNYLPENDEEYTD